MKLFSQTFTNFAIAVVFASLIAFAVFIFILFSDDEDPLRGPRMSLFDNKYPFETHVIHESLENSIEEELAKIGIEKYHHHDDNGIQSHLDIWKNLKSEWTLVIKSNVHFHPRFKSLFFDYWKCTPRKAKIVFPGYPDYKIPLRYDSSLMKKGSCCDYCYIIRKDYAKELFDEYSGGSLEEYFSEKTKNTESYIFNDHHKFEGVPVSQYLDYNCKKECCKTRGIIYLSK